MQNLPTAARWTIYVALAVVFAIACAFLSQWQFSRDADRSAQLALVKANYDAEPVPLTELLVDDFHPADEWRPVVLTGTYLPNDELLVRNRAHGGTSAFEVLTPLRLDSGRIFIVNRGWVPPAATGDGAEAVPAPPAGEVEVIARLRPGEPVPVSGRGAPEGQVPTINLPEIARLVGPDTMVEAYGRMVSELPAPAEQPQAIASPSEDPGPHLSYAIQWILFAVMGFVFIIYVIRTEVAHRREDATGEGTATDTGAGARQPVPRKGARRKDRDADIEDAILDTVDQR